MSKGLTIYFVRHGQTYFNLNSRTQGWCDPLLTPAGIEEVKGTGRDLSQVKFDAAIVSDLKRTRTTAELIIGESIYPSWVIPIREMSDFREISFGSFEGMSSNETWEIIRQYMDFDTVEEMLSNTTEKERLSALQPADPAGQGENYQDYVAHLNVGADKLLADFGHTEAVLLFIGHSINIRHIIQYLVPKEKHLPELYDMYSMKNGSMIIVNNAGGEFEIKQYGERIISH